MRKKSLPAVRIFLERKSGRLYLTGLEMKLIDELISPGIKQGQSLYGILCNVRDQLPCGLSTRYRLIDEAQLLAVMK